MNIWPFSREGRGKKLREGENGVRGRVMGGRREEESLRHRLAVRAVATSPRQRAGIVRAKPLPPGTCSHTIFVLVQCCAKGKMGHPTVKRLIRKGGRR